MNDPDPFELVASNDNNLSANPKLVVGSAFARIHRRALLSAEAIPTKDNKARKIAKCVVIAIVYLWSVWRLLLTSRDRRQAMLVVRERTGGLR